MAVLPELPEGTKVELYGVYPHMHLLGKTFGGDASSGPMDSEVAEDERAPWWHNPRDGRLVRLRWKHTCRRRRNL